jgi:glycogen synthase
MEKLRDKEIEKIVGRLKESQRDRAAEIFRLGFEDGWEWAKEEADYHELRDAAESERFPEYINEEIDERDYRSSYPYFDDTIYYKGFHKGVVSIWKQVKDKLKSWDAVVKEIVAGYK